MHSKNTMPQRVEYEKLVTGYEFTPASFKLDSEKVAAYLKAVEDSSPIYKEKGIVPPMAIAALAMASLSEGLVLPPGAIHVSQDLEFVSTVNINEPLTSYARVVRKIERGKFHMLTIGVKVLNQNKATAITGEIGFILPL